MREIEAFRRQQPVDGFDETGAKQKTMWRFFDARTYGSGELDREYMVGLIEQLL